MRIFAILRRDSLVLGLVVLMNRKLQNWYSEISHGCFTSLQFSKPKSAIWLLLRLSKNRLKFIGGLKGTLWTSYFLALSFRAHWGSNLSHFRDSYRLSGHYARDYANWHFLDTTGTNKTPNEYWFSGHQNLNLISIES